MNNCRSNTDNSMKKPFPQLFKKMWKRLGITCGKTRGSYPQKCGQLLFSVDTNECSSQ